MKIEAFNEHIIVRVDKVEEHTDTRTLVIQDNNKSRPSMGIIVSLGEKVDDVFKIGEKIVFNPFAGINIPITYTDGQEQILLDYNDIIGKVVEENCNHDWEFSKDTLNNRVKGKCRKCGIIGTGELPYGI